MKRRGRIVSYLMRSNGYNDPWDVPDGALRDALVLVMCAGLRK